MAEKENVCRKAYGPGPDNTRCGDCIHFLSIRYDKTYHKCDLRRISQGAATDHLARWPTCARFEAGQAELMYGPGHFSRNAKEIRKAQEGQQP